MIPIQKYNLEEKSLNRILDHMKAHDSGFITAYRSEYSKKENQQRNRSLLAKLQSNRYGVTSVEGSYIENYGTADEIEVGEHVFFVVDLQDKGNLKNDLIILGEEFDQDSILFVPEGGENGILIGTSKRANSWPGYNKTIKLNNPVFGKGGEFFTKVRNRPFIFESKKIEEIPLPSGWMARMSCKKTALQEWKDIDV